MRYAIFTDIHANLEALEAVLAKIDEIAQEEPVDQIWFLGDLVGYGPNPNECIEKLRERTNVIIAGNHDWAAVGKIDLEDFSEAARLSAEWTAEQLTEEHRAFLTNLPERIELNECSLVHGSPYGPLWEYLTSEVLAERSFQHFTNRYCFVGHTHVPVIFLQADTFANAPTIPLPPTAASDETGTEEQSKASELFEGDPEEVTQKLEEHINGTMPVHKESQEQASDPLEESALLDETTKIVAIRSTLQTSIAAAVQDEKGTGDAETMQEIVANATDAVAELQQQIADDNPQVLTDLPEHAQTPQPLSSEQDEETAETDEPEQEIGSEEEEDDEADEPITPEETIVYAEERLNEEIEELLALLGLSQSMVSVTNEMLIPPEGEWDVPQGYRAIINPGGVGQPRDGDARAAFMIYDTNRGFTFYRVEYDFEKTQEKIIKTGLPQYLATRLAYGR